jgi:type I restriction enzyme S subunit
MQSLIIPIKNMPKLRFREFDDEWQKMDLGKVTIKMQSGLSRQLSATDIGMPVIRSNNIQNQTINISDLAYWYTKDPQGSNTSNYILDDGDLLVNFINSRAQIGKFSIYSNDTNRNTIFTTNIMRLKFSNSTSSKFIAYHFSTKKYADFIDSITKPAVNQASFTTVDLKKFIINLPSINEQEKITGFLEAVDVKIASLKKTITLMQKFKKGVMQNLFSQNIRFKDEKGDQYSDWEERQLGDVMSESRIKGHKGNNAYKLSVKLWGKGVYGKADNTSGSINTQYYERKAGQFIYSKLDFLNCAFAIIPDDLDGYESTVDMPAFDIKAGYDGRYLLERIMQTDFYKRLGETADGSRKARRVHAEVFLGFKMLFPSQPEQRRIANFLVALDGKINLTMEELEQAKKFKKALLQQMFV